MALGMADPLSQVAIPFRPRRHAKTGTKEIPTAPYLAPKEIPPDTRESELPP